MARQNPGHWRSRAMTTIQPSGPWKEPTGKPTPPWWPLRWGLTRPPVIAGICTFISWLWNRQSIIEMSTHWPCPVRSRWNSARARPVRAWTPALTSAKPTPTNWGGPSRSPVMCMKPEKAWAIVS